MIDLVPNQDIRLFAIGRLDLNSEGLILVTNDGELANRLTHPRYGVEKVYLAQVAGRPTPEVLDKLKRGVHLAEGIARVQDVRIESHQKDSTWLEIVLCEGVNREIRRLLAVPGVIDAVGQKLGSSAPPRIDFIFVRGLRVLDAGLRDRGASDHPLAWAELTTK